MIKQHWQKAQGSKRFKLVYTMAKIMDDLLFYYGNGRSFWQSLRWALQLNKKK